MKDRAKNFFKRLETLPDYAFLAAVGVVMLNESFDFLHTHDDNKLIETLMYVAIFVLGGLYLMQRRVWKETKKIREIMEKGVPSDESSTSRKP